MTYKIWTPEYTGHAPPNWREGMKWTRRDLSDQFDAQGCPEWFNGWEYHVEPEALNSPNDDAETPDAVETGKLENIVRGLRQYPAEELAKHGITLAPEKDWATELWADALNESGRIVAANDVRKGIFDDNDRAAIELLRTRFEQMKGER